MKITHSLPILGLTAFAALLCSCADVDTAGGPAANHRYKRLYAASYDDVGKELATSEFNLIWTDPDFLNIESSAKELAYVNEQARRFGVAYWRGDGAGTWNANPQDNQSVKTMDRNHLPPEVNQCGDECRQFSSDVLADEAMKNHRGYAVAYDKSGSQAAGGAVVGILGALAGAAGGGSGMEVANAIVPVGADAAINASSSQSDIAQALSTSALALEEKYGPEHQKMKTAVDALVRKYGAQYPDLLIAITPPPVRKS